MSNTHQRLEPQFIEDWKEVNKLRKENHMKHLSFRKFSQLVSRHRFWRQTKIDIANYVIRD